MPENPLQRLSHFGQSVWNDNVSRDMITSGELQRLIDEDGVVGITSNPSIFDAAISKSSDYDQQIRKLVADGRNITEIYDALTIKDIRDACDILRVTYDDSDGQDGYVSLEVSPHLAHDTRGTINAVRRLSKLVARPNLMIKIPGTLEGIPAIEQMLYEGVNINITLLFSLQAHRDVMEAYLRALERRVEDGKPTANIHSVASFFVSRVDTEVDKRLERIISAEPDTERASLARSLLGAIAIANARLAYQEFKIVFASDRFKQLELRGANIQRPLWASTSTKNPAYSDTLYVDELIGPNTVQTLAPASIDAFRDHGSLANTVENDVESARDRLNAMESLGIKYDDVIDTLVREGVEKFAESYDSLLASLAEKCDRISAGISASHSALLGGLNQAATSLLENAATMKIEGRIASLDASMWSAERSVQRAISDRLGWLQVVDDMLQHAEAGVFHSLSGDVRSRGYERAILLGMGGSSLAPEVIVKILGGSDGFPSLEVLDTTNPDTISRIAERARNERTLYIVSSKSGSTIETVSLFRFFLNKNEGYGDDIIAITDPGSRLEVEARRAGCWKVYVNRHDIGGRYSALSYFGLVPAAAAGIDVEILLQQAKALLPMHDNNHPGIWLGAALGAAFREGRDKLTILTDDSWASFGDWLEQLIAESTGKQGVGIIPIVREPEMESDRYGDDRIFVHIATPTSVQTSALGKLQELGHPIIVVPDVLGRSFLLWEIATAVAGSVMEINPFDEPNVQEAKDATSEALTDLSHLAAPSVTASEAIERTLTATREGDYVAIQAFVDQTPEMEDVLNNLRSGISHATNAATTLGYGPRYLHSTGQLHKGGASNGVFLQIVQKPETDLNIPGEPFTFGQLFGAQSVGDYAALDKRSRRVTRVVLEGDVSSAVEALMARNVASGVPAD